MLRRSFLKFLAWLPAVPFLPVPVRGHTFTMDLGVGMPEPPTSPRLVVQEHGFSFPVSDELLETTPPSIELAVSEWGFRPDPIQPKWEDVFGVEPHR
jgi:hypothetical protein